ncbi:ACT domain-containing protein [Rhodoferax sp. PAMC 29310]|uniref:ACT domain-containing protein n=1 Tax=Rhodoferax sp. PAMC 29310 TaxID=2822760 RepID=UPI001B31E6FD|nr:ACT domain-containing protein [Rhodoferax sp. PAMC 29310]
MPPISDLDTRLRHMEPVLNAGVYVFTQSDGTVPIDPAHVMASIREPEGLSLVLEESVALAAGLKPALRCAWITLNVNSDLEAVGLTAAFATALGQAGISCNVVAGLNHDHIFVPVHRPAALGPARRHYSGFTSGPSVFR